MQRSGSAEGFSLALPGYRFRFPEDGGAHSTYRTEWWYYTGHLTDGRRHYGFELTFFRNALLPRPRQRASRWATNTIYLAHFALTDVDGGTFHAAERADRGALGTAGASAGREHTWIGRWYARVAPSVVSPLSHDPGQPHAGQPHARQPHAGQPHAGDAALWPHEIAADADFGSIHLQLEPLKPPTIHGRDGVSQKGPGPGRASHYYSYTRLRANGVLTAAGRTSSVQGLAWMDHELSSGSLSPDETGWDWFSIQLGDGWDLMLYQLRTAVGGPAAPGRSATAPGPYGSGSLVDPVGRSTFLSRGQFRIRVLGEWRSPEGVIYPAGWEIQAPRYGIDLRETPLVADQELRPAGAAAVHYWEGAVAVKGTHAGRSAVGQGYTELTGYAGPLQQLR